MKFLLPHPCQVWLHVTAILANFSFQIVPDAKKSADYFSKQS